MSGNGFLKRKITFCGYHGRMNTGDDAFCAVAAWGAKHYWNTNDISFLSRRVPKLPTPAKRAMFSKSFFPGQYSLETILNFAAAPTVIFAGGSLFYRTIDKRWLFRYIKWFQRIGRINVGAIGVSLGPYRTQNARKSIEKLFSKFSFLSLRDSRSFKEASLMDLPFKPVQSADLAGLFPKIYGQATRNSSTKSSNLTLGVSVCHYERYVGKVEQQEKRREKLMLDTLIKLANAMPVTIRLFVFNAHPTFGEVQLTNNFAERLKAYTQVEIVPYSNAPGLTWQQVGKCDAFLGIRLHSGIFACVAGVPFVMVEYHQKCTDFLDDIEAPQQWRIGDFSKSPDFAVEILKDMLQNKTQPFPINLQSLAKKAERNFTAIYSDS